MPPFYIGYTSVNQLENGYKGSVTSRRYKDVWNEELAEHPELFKSIIICTLPTKREAKQREAEIQRFLNVHKNPLYINQHINGEKFFCDQTGYRHPPELRAKWSLERKGRTHTEETKSKISKSTTGKKRSLATKRRISEAVRARTPDSELTRQRKSEGHKGKKHTETTLNKMRANSARKKPVIFRGEVFASVKEATDKHFRGVPAQTARNRLKSEGAVYL